MVPQTPLHIEDWKTLMTAVDNDDWVAVQQLRAQLPDTTLGVALINAAGSNRLKVVTELLNSPSDGILMYVHDALMEAASHGHAETLAIVLQHTDPARRACYNLALWNAVAYNHQNCVDVLFDLCDVAEVWKMANERGRSHPNEAFCAFEQRMIAQQRAVLMEAVGQCDGVRGVKKI